MSHLMDLIEVLQDMDNDITITIGDTVVKYDAKKWNAEKWNITYHDEPPISFYSLETTITDIINYKKRRGTKSSAYCYDCCSSATWQVDTKGKGNGTHINVCDAHLISNLGQRSTVRKIKGK